MVCIHTRKSRRIAKDSKGNNPSLDASSDPALLLGPFRVWWSRSPPLWAHRQRDEAGFQKLIQTFFSPLAEPKSPAQKIDLRVNTSGEGGIQSRPLRFCRHHLSSFNFIHLQPRTSIFSHPSATLCTPSEVHNNNQWQRAPHALDSVVSATGVHRSTKENEKSWCSRLYAKV